MTDMVSTADMPLVGGHLKRLFDFSGRENRKPFWLWYLVVYAGLVLVQSVIMVPAMLFLSFRMAPALDAAQRIDPITGKPVPPDPAVMFAAMGPMMYTIFGIVLVMMLVQFVLLTAAAVRRFHDRDWSGWWFAPYVALSVIYIVGMAIVLPSVFSQLPPPGTISPAPPPTGILVGFGVLGLLGFVNFGVLIFTIVRLCLPGTVGPNRYGADPLEGHRPPPGGWAPEAPRTAATVVGTPAAETMPPL